MYLYQYVFSCILHQLAHTVLSTHLVKIVFRSVVTVISNQIMWREIFHFLNILDLSTLKLINLKVSLETNY